ncbi:MAG TPA: hypothetical protein VHV51_20300 [Polyangiaceae bacterium]|jgi:serine/threonine-protein kinase|nr:hypothetical protein [Polyangiaceae bacterium]
MAMWIFRKRRAVATLLVTSACVLAPARARAEASAAQKAAAEALFDDAVKAMKNSRYADACPKLEESQRIDPGIGTLLYLGECYEKTGRSASAWATFREAASSAQAKGETERARVATDRADRLQAGLSKLTIVVAPETARLSGLHVTRDNLPVESSLFGIAIPVDPGKYHISASADGYESYQTELEISGNADAKSTRIPALKPLAAPAAAPVPAATSAPSPANAVVAPANPAPPPIADTGPSSLRTAAFVGGALGIVGLGVGSYFGVRAISKNNDAETHCPRGDTCDDQTGVDLTHQAQTAARNANITLAIGAAFVVAGVVLYLTSEPQKTERVTLSPMLGRDLAGLGLGGAFR